MPHSNGGDTSFHTLKWTSEQLTQCPSTLTHPASETHFSQYLQLKTSHFKANHSKVTRKTSKNFTSTRALAACLFLLTMSC